MEPPPRTASYTTVIKCTTCAADVPMNEMADHTCDQVTMSPLTAEPQILPGTTSSIFAPHPTPIRPARPFVPRIDPFATSRLGPGELTPASSQGSIAASPVSAGSGRRSPFLPPPRKGSAPHSRRPPSPELMPQDSAFPHFPTGKPKSKDTAKKDIERGRTKTPDDAQSIRSFTQFAKRSASVGTHRSRTRHATTESSTTFSTPSSSRQPSISTSVNGHYGVLKDVPPMPLLQPTLSNLSNTPEEQHQAVPQISPRSAPVPPQVLEEPASDVTQPQPQTEQHQSLEHSRSPSSASDSLDMRSGAATADQTDSPREPSYKAKRPPPIANIQSNFDENRSPLPRSASPVAPAPQTPSSSLGRTLTSLFSRRRGQSTSSRKGVQKPPAVDSPRYMALSPDPEPVLEPVPSISTISTISTTILSTTPSGVSEEDSYPFPTMSSPPSALPAPAEAERPKSPPTEDTEEFVKHDSLRIEQDLEQTLAKVVSVPEVEAREAELRRASIDSASSYGSEDFSYSSTSSRSTNPSDIYAKASSTTSFDDHNKEIDLAPPKAFDTHEHIPDSPTDPCYQHGRLETVPESETQDFARSDNDEPKLQSFPEPPPEPQSFNFPMPPMSPRHRRPSTPGGNRGICRGCLKLIVSGQKSVSSKDGRLTGRYHKECFVCKTCKSPFATADFYVHDDHPYCAHDYHVANNTLCASCGDGIEGEYMETSNVSGSGTKKFHQYCLRCTTCNASLHNDYFELGGKVYCEKDAFKQAHSPRSPYDTAPSRPSPLNREYIASGQPERGLPTGRFPERRITKLMMTY